MHISELIKKFEERPKEKVLHPRQEIIKMFVDRLNVDRTGKFKPLTPGFVASKMYNAGLKTNFDLWWFWGYLKDVRSFSAVWWASLDPKKAKK